MLDRIQRILNLSTLKSDQLSVVPGDLSNRSNMYREGPDGLQVHETLNEQTKKTLEINGKVARHLDYSGDNLNDPQVYISGYGLWRLSYLKKDIQNDLNRLAEMVGTRPASQLLQILSDIEGKKSSNLYVAFKLLALAEVEEFLAKPTTKRRLTQMKTK
jgi:hypothetical protein